MVSVNLYSKNSKDLINFLSSFYNSNFEIKTLTWEHKYENPIEITDIISAFIDNNDNYNLLMWVSLDNGVYINITEKNANNFIKYLFERFPY